MAVMGLLRKTDHISLSDHPPQASMFPSHGLNHVITRAHLSGTASFLLQSPCVTIDSTSWKLLYEF